MTPPQSVADLGRRQTQVRQGSRGAPLLVTESRSHQLNQRIAPRMPRTLSEQSAGHAASDIARQYVGAREPI